jgi:hypothetical protein
MARLRSSSLQDENRRKKFVQYSERMTSDSMTEAEDRSSWPIAAHYEWSHRLHSATMLLHPPSQCELPGHPAEDFEFTVNFPNVVSFTPGAGYNHGTVPACCCHTCCC